MWGQDCVGCAAVDKHIIIPTRVGTRLAVRDDDVVHGDHPHACGDKTLSSKSLKDCWGSSPRVWGQVIAKFFSKGRTRIIPTRVGTSSLRLASLRLRWDHPHACGDKCGVPQLFYELRGSSPRVWGQVFDIFSAAIATGIIPTRVGTSKRYISEKLLFGDHPHACGDKFLTKVLR